MVWTNAINIDAMTLFKTFFKYCLKRYQDFYFTKRNRQYFLPYFSFVIIVKFLIFSNVDRYHHDTKLYWDKISRLSYYAGPPCTLLARPYKAAQTLSFDSVRIRFGGRLAGPLWTLSVFISVVSRCSIYFLWYQCVCLVEENNTINLLETACTGRKNKHTYRHAVVSSKSYPV